MSLFPTSRPGTPFQFSYRWAGLPVPSSLWRCPNSRHQKTGPSPCLRAGLLGAWIVVPRASKGTNQAVTDLVLNLDRRALLAAFLSGSSLHFVRDSNEGQASVSQRNRIPGISTHPHRWIERQFSQEVNIHRLRRSSAATMTEDVDAFLAVRTLQRSEEHTSELQSLRHLVC